MATPRYEGYIFDLDGTIYLGDELIPGARQTIEWIRDAGGAVVFLSNKPLEPRASYAAKLTRLGIPTPSEDVINSTQALMHLLREQHPGARLYVIGETRLLDEMRAAGFVLSARPNEVDIVVAAFDRTLDYTKLNIAHQALVRGALLYATNGDKTCPVRGGEIPDCAGVIAFLEATSGCTVEAIAGKPSRHILDAALARLGVAPQRCLMVGDRLATDILMGVQAGIDTALVLSGVTRAADLSSSAHQPTHVLASVADCP
jgi:HAD superfamily hydrolase (TIGR01450 family)